jgi:hypothetical protein
VQTIWRSRGDPVKIMTLRVDGIIGPASSAGHVVLSSSLNAWDIRGTQRCSQMPGPCPPHALKEGHPRRFTVTHGATATALVGRVVAEHDVVDVLASCFGGGAREHGLFVLGQRDLGVVAG